MQFFVRLQGLVYAAFSPLFLGRKVKLYIFFFSVFMYNIYISLQVDSLGFCGVQRLLSLITNSIHKSHYTFWGVSARGSFCSLRPRPSPIPTLHVYFATPLFVYYTLDVCICMCAYWYSCIYRISALQLLKYHNVLSYRGTWHYSLSNVHMVCINSYNTILIHTYI